MLKFIVKLGIGANLFILSHGMINSRYGSESRSASELDMKQFESEYIEKKGTVELVKTNRDEAIKSLSAEKFDVLIIGGGSAGAGVLLEATKKGLKCALIESHDFASGTSSKSSKLAHGGIRYLQDVFDFKQTKRYEKLKLVFEALHERDFLLNSAPFMNKTVEIKIPFKNVFEMEYYYAGVYLYHTLYYFYNLTKPGSENIFPWPKLNLREKTISLYEGQFFDSRQCMLSITSSGRKNGSNFANYVEFIEYFRDTNSKIKGVKAYDKINKKFFMIYAHCVVNCTGVSADEYFNREDVYKHKMIKTSKGSHLVVSRSYLVDKMKIDTGVMIPKTSDGRVLFILPYQQDYYLIGTTDTPTEKTIIPECSKDDIEYLKNEILTAFKLDLSDFDKEIKSSWAGLRPLVPDPESLKSDNKDTKSLARNHVIRLDDKTGIVSLMGGKWTTYRAMGEDTLAAIEKNDNFKEFLHKIKNSENSENQPTTLSGSIIGSYRDQLEYFNNLTEYLSNKYSLDKASVNNLIFRYGTNAEKILEINSSECKNKYLNDESYYKILVAELIYSIRYEMCTRPNDFICRRNGLAFVDSGEALKISDRVAEVMSKELNWGRARLNKEKSQSRENLRNFI